MICIGAGFEFGLHLGHPRVYSQRSHLPLPLASDVVCFPIGNLTLSKPSLMRDGQG